MTQEEHMVRREGHPQGCRCMTCHWDKMGRENRMHFIGMITAIVVVFAIGFGLGSIHGSHHGKYSERGWDRMGGHMRKDFGSGMMRGEQMGPGSGYVREMGRGMYKEEYLDDTATTSVR